jgi:diguanylate cyclase (GGDEF)-like protein/PAS domain S-box-containing protein
MDSEEKKRILIIDDNEDDFVLTSDMIEEAAPGNYDIHWASSFAQGLAMAGESVYAVAFLDYRLGDGDGLKFLKEANARGFTTPIVFLTGKGNYWVGVESIRRGVSDFLVKGEITPAMLERAILHSIERKKILTALKASEEKFRAVFEDSGIGIAITDIDGAISDTNVCFNDIFGASGANLHGRSLASLSHPDDGGLVSCFTRLRGGKGTCASVENRYIGQGGKEMWGRTLLSTILDENGNLHKVVAMISDITQAKLAEIKLQLAAKVYESAMDGIMVTDAEGVILSVNPAFTRITGYTEIEAVGKKPSILKSGHHDADFYKEMWEKLLRDGRWKGEIWNRRKNGATYPQAASIASVTDNHGAILQYVGIFQDITDIKEYQAEISYHAYHDPLTGLPNRLLFNDRLRHAIATARRDHKRAAVMYIDLDGFKEINDTYGHNVGDLVLQGVAVRLTAALRDEDTISRVGGDEFIILLEHTGHKRGVRLVAEKILSAIKEPFSLKGSEISVGASLGVVMFPCEVQDVETLIKSADTAMYAAKQDGKNRFKFYGDLKEKRGKAPGSSTGD